MSQTNNPDKSSVVSHSCTSGNSIEQCPEFPHFGAWYPDATCIDGYLWDLDKYEDGKLYGGGEDPCPFCNTEEYIEWGWSIEDIQEGDVPTKEQVREHALNHIQQLKERYGKKTS